MPVQSFGCTGQKRLFRGHVGGRRRGADVEMDCGTKEWLDAKMIYVGGWELSTYSVVGRGVWCLGLRRWRRMILLEGAAIPMVDLW
jgi:hypothetical protein